MQTNKLLVNVFKRQISRTLSFKSNPLNGYIQFVNKNYDIFRFNFSNQSESNKNINEVDINASKSTNNPVNTSNNINTSSKSPEQTFFQSNSSNESNNKKSWFQTIRGFLFQVLTILSCVALYNNFYSISDYIATLLTPSKHMLIIEKLSDRLRSYQMNIMEATNGKVAVRSYKARQELLEVLGFSQLGDISPNLYTKMYNIYKKYEYVFSRDIASCRKLMKSNKEIVLKSLSIELNLDNLNDDEMLLLSEAFVYIKLFKLLSNSEKSAIIPSNRLTGRSSVVDTFAFKSKLDKKFLSLVAAIRSIDSKPKAYVLTFQGDIYATQLSNLREEILAVIRYAQVNRGDFVVLRLTSGGGTVTGYGLGASLLYQLRQNNIPLIVCVDEVAASGGYMMAAMANEIVAAPFAVLGSIGVMTTIPNYSERLKREGVSFEDITAGKYKRTLVPYKPATEDDRNKVKEDLEKVFTEFKSFLTKHRPKLQIKKVATGEVWSGHTALELGLCDQLNTSDNFINLLHEAGTEVLFLKHKLKDNTLDLNNLFASLAKGLVEALVSIRSTDLRVNPLVGINIEESQTDQFRRSSMAVDSSTISQIK